MLSSHVNLLKEENNLDKRKSGTFIIISIILIAACLRGPITGVGPLITTFQAELGLSASVAGLLTTLPLLTFAVVSFVTGAISRRLGAGRTMLCSLITLFIGLLIRSFTGTAGLFIGTVIVAIGIGINNVLLPAVIKARFPDKMGLLTGLYTTLMAGFASLSTGTSVPLTLAFGWHIALCIWAVLVVLAIVFWIPNTGMRFDDGSTSGRPARRHSVAASPITWYITLYMGFQSMVFYFSVAWFSTILQSFGYTPQTSGILNMAMMLCGLPGSFLMPIIASKTKHQSLWGAFIGLLFIIGTIGLMYAYTIVGLVVTIITFGFGTGGCIAFCMVLFGLHTHNAEDATSLSSLAQGVGYIFAAVAPVLIGRVYDATGSWTVPLIIMIVVAAATLVSGWLSGLDKMVETD